MLFDSLNTLPGLLPAVFRGQEFHVLDTSAESGRRVMEYLFPGVDAAAYDDFGVLPGVVDVDALIVSDAYIVRAKALQKAFETPGPATFIHPWLGPMTVIMDEPAEIRFSAKELRVVRIRARFKRVPGGGVLSFLGGSGLPVAIGAVLSIASALATAVGTKVLSSARGAAVTRSSRIVQSAIADLHAPQDTSRFVAELRTQVAAMAPATPAAFNVAISSIAANFGDVALTPAVAAAAEATAIVRPEPASIISVGLSLATSMTAAVVDAPASADRALLAAVSAYVLAHGATQSSYATYVSRREALDFRAATGTAIYALIDALAPLSSSVLQGEASELERAARSLHAAIVADIHEVIGRLPDVLTFKPDRSADAWQIALHVAGDDASRIEEVYADIVRRNDPRHPAALDAGAIEVLDIRR